MTHASTPTRAPLFAAADITVLYGATRALDRVALTVEAGQIVALVGSNGCGKSTLLRVAAHVCGPEFVAGTRAFDGVVSGRASGLRRGQLARKVAFVPQHPEVSAPFTAREIVRLGRFALARDEAAVERALREVGLADRGDVLFHALSGGERQRTAIARAFAQLDHGGLLLLDEPFSGIDPGEVSRVVDALRRRAERGAVVLSLHDPGLARAFCSHAVVLRQGTVLAKGLAADTLTTSILTDAYGHAMEEHASWIVPRLSPPASMRPCSRSTGSSPSSCSKP